MKWAAGAITVLVLMVVGLLTAKYVIIEKGRRRQCFRCAVLIRLGDC